MLTHLDDAMIKILNMYKMRRKKINFSILFV
jgi:hypothetical protein